MGLERQGLTIAELPLLNYSLRHSKVRFETKICGKVEDYVEFQVLG